MRERIDGMTRSSYWSRTNPPHRKERKGPQKDVGTFVSFQSFTSYRPQPASRNPLTTTPQFLAFGSRSPIPHTGPNRAPQ